MATTRKAMTAPLFRHLNEHGYKFFMITTRTSKEKKFRPSFLGFKSQKFVHESGYDEVPGTDNDKQSLKNPLASVFHLWLLEAFS